jgi:phenylpyruvate tautomerase PptA (4-oxalocrotonate tautomerase family)
MPLTSISLRRGKPPEYRKAIMDGLYEAMRETFNVPEDDRFMSITQHDADEFLYGAHYLGIERSDDLVLIQLTVSNTRTVEQRKALFAAIAKKLGDNPGIRPQDVFINLVEVAKENWSFGHGLAQNA